MVPALVREALDQASEIAIYKVGGDSMLALPSNSKVEISQIKFEIAHLLFDRLFMFAFGHM